MSLPAGPPSCGPAPAEPAPRAPSRPPSHLAATRRRPAAAGCSALLRALRPPLAGRSPVDRGLAGGLRAWLDDELAAGGEAAGGAALVVDRWSVTGTPPVVAELGRPPAVTGAAARQALVRVLFRQLVVTGRIGQPFDDAVAGLRLSAWGGAVVDFVASLPAAARAQLRREVADAGRAMAADLPALPPSWLPRTTARRSAPLAGGAVVLRATASLALGQPAAERASVCLVDVRAGEPLDEHRHDRRYLALVEALCAGAPPCRVATYYPRHGHLEADDPTDEDLASAVPAVVAAVAALRRRAATAVTQAAAVAM